MSKCKSFDLPLEQEPFQGMFFPSLRACKQKDANRLISTLYKRGGVVFDWPKLGTNAILTNHPAL